MVLIKRSSMMLFSGVLDPYSHAVRIVLAEKAVGVDVLFVDDAVNLDQEDFLEINPQGNVPTLVDRELILTEASVIMEYLDERFPHPPLLPVYPVARAKSRLALCRLREEWYKWTDVLAQDPSPEVAQQIRQDMHTQLMRWEYIFSDSAYFLSEDFSLVDCYIIPILWRLPSYGVELTDKMPAIAAYCEKMFLRPSFRASLTEHESEIREEYDLI